MRQVFVKNIKQVNLGKLLMLSRHFGGIKIMTSIGIFCLMPSGAFQRLQDDNTMWQHKARRNHLMPPM